MRLLRFASNAGWVLAGALALTLAAAPTRAATITIVNLDDPGEGFNDPTPAAPVGGNPGTTIGAQRLYVFQYAANIWGSILPDDVPVFVEANFDPLDCDSTSAVLGSAGPNSLISDFPGAAHPMTWYHQALANKLSGVDQDPGVADIGAQFNSGLGQPGCFPLPWYYGVDGNEGNAVELLPVVLHEIGHGLGFSTSTLAGVEEVFPHIYDYFLLDKTQNMHWPDMTEGQRVASAQNCSNLVWDGPSVVLQSPEHLGPRPVLKVNSPSTIAGNYNVGLPSFGPGLTTGGISGNLVLVNDGMGVPTNACEPLLNGAALVGKIALIDRGACTFVTKIKRAQDAGAIAVVIADSAAGCPALGMGGADPTITIPSVRVTQDDGARLKAALLLGTVNVTLRLDPSLKAGADDAGRVLVFTPLPYQLGSSVSHWDMSATPNLLMEPALNQDLSKSPDLTVAQFADIGWFSGVLDAGSEMRHRAGLEASVPNPTPDRASISFTLAREEEAQVTVYDLSGRVMAKLAGGRLPAGRHTVQWDGADLTGHAVPAGVYLYRLRTPSVEQAKRLVMVR